jgi:hypothetical protein
MPTNIKIKNISNKINVKKEFSTTAFFKKEKQFVKEKKENTNFVLYILSILVYINK